MYISNPKGPKGTELKLKSSETLKSHLLPQIDEDEEKKKKNITKRIQKSHKYSW